MEPHDDGTGMVLLRNSRRAICRMGKVVGAGEQSDSRSAEGYDRTRSSSTSVTAE